VAAIDAAIDAARAGRHDIMVASANPGCSMFLAAAGLPMRHPVDIVRDTILPTDAEGNRP
jgi:hypothetical protein